MDVMKLSDKTNGSNKDVELSASDDRLSRRGVLKTATVAAAAAAGASAVLADAIPAAGYGAPMVELYVPAGVLSLEQKSDMIKRITDVVLSAMRLPPDPTRRLFVEVFETAEGGFGVNGQVFVLRGK